jgi:hypothetical protein
MLRSLDLAALQIQQGETYVLEAERSADHLFIHRGQPCHLQVEVRSEVCLEKTTDLLSSASYQLLFSFGDRRSGSLGSQADSTDG